MPVDVMRTIASVGSSMIGSGTLSTRTSRLPCQATAFMSGAPRKFGFGSLPYPASGRATLALARRPLARAAHDLRDHRALGLRVVIRRLPLLAREASLRLLVEAPVGGVVAQPVAEEEARPRGLAALGEDVDVDVLALGAVHAVTLLADADGVAVRLERGAVRRLVVGVGDGDQDVDDPLRPQARDGGRADVLDRGRGR